MSRRGAPHRYDAKKMTMRRLVFFDNDLASRFDDEEDASAVQSRHSRSYGHNRGGNRRGGGAAMVIRSYLENRRDQQLQRGAGGTVTPSTVILNLIKVPRGAAFGKDYILQVIGQYVDDFKPILLKVERNDLLFYVEDDETAAAIKAISRRVKDPKTNSPVTFLVSRVPAGFATICPNERRCIEEVLRKRYNAAEHSLDLSEFGLDEVFRRENLHLSLTRNNVMMAVVDLIDKHFGDVTALSVKSNRIRFLDYFANLTYRIKNVQVLDLSSNQIDHLTELEKLKGWPVETLFFENNPICATYSSAEAYTSAIHRVFPKVIQLDGIPVQRSREVGMPDLDETIKIPASKPSFYGSEERRALIEAFVIEFMTVYDDPDPNNRKNLLNAYDQNATFSMMAENLPDAHDRRPYFETYKAYRQSSHNLLFVDKWERYRDKILHKGAMDIVVELSKLPATKHMTDTFLLDVSMVTEKFICFAVQGFFYDGLQKVGDELKYFCRNFVVKCKGEGKVAVASDLLYVSGVFSERVQRYKTLLSSLLKMPPNVNSTPASASIADVPSTSVRPSSALQAALTPQQMAAGGDTNMQQQMIEAFCRESNMKVEWSRKCLEDQNWDYAVAGEAFLAVRDRIPPEAFQS